MRIVGHGVDLIDLERVAKLLRSHDFLDGWFSPREIAELGERTNRVEVVAGRVAAKEATAKALRTGFSEEVSWHDIEVFSDEAGPLTIQLSGRAREIALELRVAQVLLSISHSRTFVIACAIAVRSATYRDT